MSETKKEYKIANKPNTLYKVVKNAKNPYVMIDRRPIDNPALSFKAKGILTYLMARPDGWEVCVKDLANHAKDRKASIRSGMRELKAAGHIKQRQMRDNGRITGLLIEVYEVPYADFQHVENQNAENQTQVLSNKLESNKNNNKAVTAAVDLPDDLLIVYSQEIGKVTPTIKKELIKLIESYSLEWTYDAIKEAVFNNVRKINYMVAILKRWKDEGKESKKQKRDSKGIKPKNQREKENLIDKVLGVEYSEADRQAAKIINARQSTPTA